MNEKYNASALAIPRLFSRGLIRNKNYTKFKIKENLNILTSKKIFSKKKDITKKKIHKVLQLLSMMFYIQKLLNDFFIINPPSYIFFNLYS